VVEYPEATAAGTDDQVAVVHRQVAYRGRGQVALQRLPGVAIVEGHEDAVLGPRVEQALALGVGAHHAHIVPVRNALGGLAPVLARIMRDVDIGLEIIDLVALDGDVGAGRIARIRADRVHLAPRTQSGRRHVAPVRPVVLGEPQPRIVGTGPEHAFLRGRGRERIDDRVAAGGARPAGRLALALRLRVLVGEDGADHLPVLAGIRGPHDLLTPHVQGVGLERRGCERGVPGVVGAGGSRRAAKGPDRRRRYAHGDVRAQVVAGDVAAGAGTEDDRRIPLARDQVARFAAADRVPVVVGDD